MKMKKISCAASGKNAVRSQGLLLRKFWHVSSGFWTNRIDKSVISTTITLLLSIILQLFIQYRLNFWGRDFFDAFGQRDEAALQQQALIFLPLAGLSIIVAVFAIWARMAVQRKWRAWLSQFIIDLWLKREPFRQPHFTFGEDRNPEYRLAEDVRIATDNPVGLLTGFLNAVFGAVIFISILWNVGGDLTVQILDYTLTVPKYLVIAVTLYSILLSAAMALIGRRLVDVIAAKNVAEAQFRSVGSRLREQDSSSITSEQQRKHLSRLTSALDEVTGRWRDLAFQFMRTTMVSQGNILLAPVIAWALCAPKYLIGTMTLGEVAQVTAAFIIVQSALNWLVENYPGVADCLSSINRVASLLIALEPSDIDESGSDVSS
jgi:putative ATP-binding cassette transporter